MHIQYCGQQGLSSGPAFERNGGILRTHEAIPAGIHSRTLYGMWNVGAIESAGRGLSRLTSLPP